MISVNHLTVEFSTRPVLDDVSFVINKRDKIGLTGKNGAGKSTLLKTIAGLQAPTSGTVAVPNDLKVGYLPQQMPFTDTVTLTQEVRKAFSHVDALQAKIDRLNDQLAVATDYESPEYQALLDRLDTLTQRQVLENPQAYEAEMEKTLLGLGFVRSDFDRPTSEFSGGWRMRVELAKLLLTHPDVLLLDEPTNHLDIESIQWLESLLITSPVAVVLVSHDRAFLDNITHRTIEITLGRAEDYAVPYSQYLVLRQERHEQQLRAYANQQKQIADTEAFIERFRYKATKAVQVQSRRKALEKIERIEVDEIDTSHISLRFPPAPRSGDYPVIADAVGKAYGDHQVFSDATFTIRRGEKVAFVGKNGAGKSTLVKCIMGEIPHTGTLRVGHGVKIGYFAQNQAQLLDQQATVFDTVDRVATGPIRTRIRDILGAFMFAGDDIDKPVHVLSGGEKTRLAMIRLLLEPVNLLILDEPTNHLDIPTKDILKQAIRDFQGTVVLVSHDRDFLDGLVDKVYEFADGRVTEHLGGIHQYLERRRLASLRDLERKDTPAVQCRDAPLARPPRNRPKDNIQSGRASSAPSPSTKAADTPAQSGRASGASLHSLSYAERRERDKARKRLTKRVAEAEAEVTRLEGTVREIEAAIAAGGDLPADIYQRHADATKAMENAMSLWELASQDLDQYNASHS